ncbi:hypothetical protein KIN20_000431 [Parelaphostrongylus tenuis]|uniref:Uncharacterized protein n=1 Tax=Parelaphostrongylus tenuis TaxID=148309 RepID=A0AAD5LS64_PARTN|nr:hypothetical protein KIN20_000431 [Parelaphostrongylus tenuis]
MESPLGTHGKKKHDGVDFEIEVTILAQEQKTSARKALWINTTNPTINRRDECLVISRDMMFKWSGTYYKQLRGLAMRQRLAATFAMAFMSKIEAPVLNLGPPLYCRYMHGQML